MRHILILISYPGGNIMDHACLANDPEGLDTLLLAAQSPEYCQVSAHLDVALTALKSSLSPQQIPLYLEMERLFCLESAHMRQDIINLIRRTCGKSE